MLWSHHSDGSFVSRSCVNLQRDARRLQTHFSRLEFSARRFARSRCSPNGPGDLSDVDNAQFEQRLRTWEGDQVSHASDWRNGSAFPRLIFSLDACLRLRRASRRELFGIRRFDINDNSL
jgi:hypothetical protein